MEPAAVVALLWLLFGGTHIGLASDPIRGPLVTRLGERGFDLLFSLVAAISFAMLVNYYAGHRLEGALGPAMGHSGILWWASMISIVAGFALAAASLVSYPRSPYALFGHTAVRQPRGIERVTRHGFFVGVILVAAPHALLATRLVGTVFTAGFVLLAAAGAWHQDRKFLARRGEAHAEYVARTSVIPFAAVVSGRQRLAWNELPVRYLAGGAAAALLLRYLHDGMFMWGGAVIITVVVGGGAVETLQSWRRARRAVARAERVTVT
jgi:uncharacterized membrane protein